VPCEKLTYNFQWAFNIVFYLFLILFENQRIILFRVRAVTDQIGLQIRNISRALPLFLSHFPLQMSYVRPAHSFHGPLALAFSHPILRSTFKIEAVSQHILFKEQQCRHLVLASPGSCLGYLPPNCLWKEVNKHGYPTEHIWSWPLWPSILSRL
jgi:hypothetical protein